MNICANRELDSEIVQSGSNQHWRKNEKTLRFLVGAPRVLYHCSAGSNTQLLELSFIQIFKFEKIVVELHS